MTINLFQIIALLTLAGLIAATLTAVPRRIVNRREAAFLLMIWLVAAAAVAFPQLTVIAAKALGIGRGADLVSYCAVVLMLVGFTMIYVRLRRLRRELTLLVRELAIRDAIINEGQED